MSTTTGGIEVPRVTGIAHHVESQFTGRRLFSGENADVSLSRAQCVHLGLGRGDSIRVEVTRVPRRTVKTALVEVEEVDGMLTGVAFTRNDGEVQAFDPSFSPNLGIKRSVLDWLRAGLS